MPPCKLRGNHGPLLGRLGYWVGGGCAPVVSRGGRLRYKMSYTELHP